MESVRSAVNPHKRGLELVPAIGAVFAPTKGFIFRSGAGAATNARVYLTEDQPDINSPTVYVQMYLRTGQYYNMSICRLTTNSSPYGAALATLLY